MQFGGRPCAWTVGVICREYAQTGSTHKHGKAGSKHKHRMLNNIAADMLMEAAGSKPDAYLQELADDMQRRSGDPQWSVWSVCRGLRELGYSSVVITKAAVEARGDQQQMFLQEIELLAEAGATSDWYVFLDETAFK